MYKEKIFALLSVALILALFAGCVTLPEPDSEEDALIIGRLVLSYPDGFIGGPARDINHGVLIVLRDLDRDRDYLVSTNGGYYRLPVPGGRQFVLVSYRYEQSDADTVRTLGPIPVNLQFAVESHSVVFLGDVAYVAVDPNVVARSERGSRAFRTYADERSVSVDADPSIVRDYLEIQNPESLWLTYPVIVPPVVSNAWSVAR